MLEKVISKIKEEIEKSNDKQTKVIGKYLLTQIETNEETIQAINAGEKNLKKCMEEVVRFARTQAVNGCAILSDEEVYKKVREYFGIKVIQDKMLEVEIDEIKEKHNIKNQGNDEVIFQANLEDFLK
ncbi:Cas9 inhibitor AcrIIA9 family protein [Clostridium perfringens]|uniref:Cas9 inhibitor AcrIIA9 family protein n=1 Tax=Clostridium perfringens TaxID=1502 RepID=UPI00096AB480|nr:Cas9 inhibitor AcrIIA9 family protein [Clostridium perfringens]